MKEEELKKLIKKYYNGESTEDEEKTLRDHFRHDDITEGYEAEKIIFGFYTASGEVPEPSTGFEERILAGFDASDRKTGFKMMRRQLLPLFSAAAGLLIIAGSYFFFINRSESRNTFSDPQVAYAQTMKILIEVSSQLNHGAQALEPVSKINKMTAKSFESINRSTIIIKKSLKNLDNLQKASEITHITVDTNKNK